MNLEYLKSIGLVILISALIGLEREREDKPAGLRTILLVSLGACLASILSLKLVEIAEGISLNGLQLNFTRISAYVIAGIGFLGGGVIMKKQNHLEGITTASVLWIIVVNSLLIGYGNYFLGALMGLLIYGILKLKYLEKRRK